MLDNYYAKYQARLSFKNKQNKIFETVNSKLRKVQNSISKINTVLQKRENGDKYKLYGELLTANLYMKADYVKEIEL